MSAIDNPLLAEARYKLRWSVDSGVWSARVTPEEARALLDALDNNDGPRVHSAQTSLIAPTCKAFSNHVEVGCLDPACGFPKNRCAAQ